MGNIKLFPKEVVQKPLWKPFMSVLFINILQKIPLCQDRLARPSHPGLSTACSECVSACLLPTSKATPKQNRFQTTNKEKDLGVSRQSSAEYTSV